MYQDAAVAGHVAVG